MKKILFIAVIMVLLLFRAEAQRMSLEDIRSAIIQAHPSLKMYDADIRAMDEAAKGARTWMPPDVGTGLFMFPYNPKYTKKGEMGEEGMGQYMISAQQMIPNKKRQNAEASYMSAMSSVEKERKNAALNELVSDAKKAYYEWVVMKKKINVVNQNEKLLEFMIKDAEIRYKNGMDKLSAYYKAKAALGTLQNMRLMLENNIRQRKISINTLMNRDPLTEFDIDTTYIIKDISAWTIDSASLVSTRSDLRAIERQIQLSSLQQSLERARLKPEFGVRYEHMIGLGGQPAQYTAMAMMRIPFARWSSRMYRANIESLRWKRESLQWQKQMQVNELSGMISGMKTEWEIKRRQLHLYEDRILPALHNNYKTMQLGYGQNTEELFMLYDAWETLNMTQLEYLTQLQELLSIQVELDRLLEIK
jgi:outer membrane protein TolC